MFLRLGFREPQSYLASVNSPDPVIIEILLFLTELDIQATEASWHNRR